MARLEVEFQIEGDDKLRRVVVREGTTIGELLDQIRRDTGRTDLTEICSDDTKLAPDELVADWVDDIVVRVGRPEEPPAPAYPPIDDLPAGLGHPEEPPAPAYPAFVPIPQDGYDDVTRTVVNAKVHIAANKAVQNIKDGQLRVFTTQDYDSMVIGEVMAIPLDSTRAQVEAAIRRQFRIRAHEHVLLFLSGGSVFSDEFQDGGRARPMTLNDLFGRCDFLSRKIYAVVVRRPPGDHVFQTNLEKATVQVCNYSTDEMKYLLSPVEPAENAVCYSAVACLLGYLACNGYRSEDLMRALAYVTGFAPLVCGISQLMNNQAVDGMTVAAVTASLHALCRQMVPFTIPDNRVFEHLLRVCSYVSHMALPEGMFDDVVKYIDHIPDGDDLQQFVDRSGQPNPACYYCPDGEDVNVPLSVITGANYSEVEMAFQNYSSFRPVGAASLAAVFEVRILLYKQGLTVLFLRRGDDDSIIYVNPEKGVILNITQDLLARVVSRGAEDKAPILLAAEDVEEVCDVVIDCSGSMLSKLDGKSALGMAKPKPEEKGGPLGDTPRIYCAWQYLSLFANRTYGFRLPTLIGMIRFNDDVDTVCAPSPISKDFELAITKLEAKGKTHLYDAILQGIENIENCDPGHRFVKAKKRILVFSDGVDKGSTETSPMRVAQQLVSKNIILDSVHLTAQNDVSRDLVKLSHATGGYAFHVTDPAEGLSLFENEAFLILRMRPPVDVVRDITEDVWGRVRADFDDRIDNTELLTVSKRPEGLYTPRGMLSHDAVEPHTQRREKRMMKEIRHVVSKQDDERFRVYVNSGDFNEWKLFVASPAESPYGKLWWSMSIVFPPEYPAQPPLFRFISPIHHVNVSDDGRVCLYELTDGYNMKTSVVSLILAVLNMFANPQVQFATHVERRLQFTKLPDGSFAPDDKYIELVHLSAENAMGTPEDWLTGIPRENIHDGAGFAIPPEEPDDMEEDTDGTPSIFDASTHYVRTEDNDMI